MSYILAIVGFLLMSLALFLSAGRWDIPTFWIFLGLVFLSRIAYISMISKELKERRRSPGSSAINRHLLGMVFFLSFFSFMVAGLDVGRFHWFPLVPFWLTGLALGVMVFSFSLSIWSMKINPFFLPVVRIQKERGHYPVMTGPYRIVRHPGNLASVVLFLSSGLALGSWWSFIAFLPAVLVMLRHTVLEDSFLKRCLPGYPEFAKRVNYRWIPGIW